MNESKKFPPTMIVSDEFGQMLQAHNVEPVDGSEYITFGLLAVFRSLQEIDSRRRKWSKRKKDTEQPEWLQLYLHLQQLFGVLAEIELPEVKTEKKKVVKESKPAPSEQPLHEDLTPFKGKPLTKRYGPYALSTRVFNTLMWNIYGKQEKTVPIIMMADQVAQKSEAELLVMSNISEESVNEIKQLLTRIKFESRGGINNSPFIVRVPSLYWGITAEAKEFRPELVERFEKLEISDGKSVDLYKLACLTEADFDPLGRYLTLFVAFNGKESILRSLELHANDIYLQK